MYNDGDYLISEPNSDKQIVRDPDLIIEKHCWLIIKFLEQKKSPVVVNDVIRFGRVSFKVTELVITDQEIREAQQILDWANNNNEFIIAPDEVNVSQRNMSDIDLDRSLNLNLGPER